MSRDDHDNNNSDHDDDRAQDHNAPETPEELINRASSGSGSGHARRPARGHGYEIRGLGYVPVSRLYEGRFGRMFRLPPFVPDEARIAEIAAAMTEGDQGRDPELNNPDIPAGYTYLGQFIDHDLTFDPQSSLTRANDPDALTNFRSPRFDLDSLYGRGPADDPFLYDKSSAPDHRFLIGHNGQDDDLPRNSQATALIGDPRNDENIFVSQLELTMLKFHNKVVEWVQANPRARNGSEGTFDAAQRIVRWHYQWIVVHDFLRRTVGDQMLTNVFDETSWYPTVKLKHYIVQTTEPYMPLEFSVAAYRFGHSQVRGAYKLNTLVGPLPTFTPGGVNEDPLDHFGGFRVLPEFWTVEWDRFFEVDGAGSDARQQTRLIDTKLANPLAKLPPEIGGDRPSLIDRNLTRGARLLLPSGQDIARAMRVAPLSDAELELPEGGPAPLWYYVLREAQVQAGGRHLGEVGGRIVAEVFIGLLAKDPSSYLRLDPAWKPFLGEEHGRFDMPDLLSFAGHGLEIIGTTRGPVG